MTDCALGPADRFYVIVGARKFGRAWVSIEGVKGTAVAAVATSAKVSAKKQSAISAEDFRNAAATAAGEEASVTAAASAAAAEEEVSAAVALVAAAAFAAAALVEAAEC